MCAYYTLIFLHVRSLPPNYPSVPPVFELEASQSGVCTYSDADELYDCLVTESLKRIGDMMIFDLVTMAQEFMSCTFIVMLAK